MFEGNFSKGLPSHRGVVLLFDSEDGSLKGVFDAGAVTAVRTAAASGVATRVLAVTGAERLCILGYGEQALAHVEAMCLVRPVRQVAVWGRSFDRAQEFAAKVASRYAVEVRATPTVEEAVAGANVICTVTAAREPILRGETVAPGTHVNLVGSSFADSREVDSAMVARSRFFVDGRQMVEALGGEYREAIRDGSIGAAHLLAEIGDVLAGRATGRRSPDEITAFKSVGLIAEDLAAARYLYDKAVREPHPGATWIDL